MFCCCLFKEILENVDHGTCLTCRPVLTQLLVPKTTRETAKNLQRLTRRPFPHTQDQVQVPPMLLGYGLSCLTDRSDRNKNLLLTAKLNTQRKKTELTTSYIQQGNT